MIQDFPVRDLSKTVLSLEPGQKSDECLQLTKNKPFITRDGPAVKRGDRDGTPLLTPSKFKITVQTDNLPKRKPKGWIFGRDDKLCDYQLDADEKRGVSREHFEICHNWDTQALMIINLSDHPLVIQVGDDSDTITQGQRRALCHARSVIEVGELMFTLDIPNRGQLQSAYDENLQNYRKIAQQYIPDLSSLAVEKGGTDTPAVTGPLATSTSTSLPKYHCRRTLGHGASGTVQLALDRWTGFLVALKEFSRKRPTAKILSEIEILRSIKHTHIPRFIEVIEQPKFQLIMEFVSGVSLDKLPNVTRDETLQVGQQLTMVVSYLHDQGISHRDIKPANTLIVRRGRDLFLKVVDYGESSEESDMTTFCGTPMYRAPEIVDIAEIEKHQVEKAKMEGRAQYSNAVDVWSIGIILAEYWYHWFFLCLNELSDTPRDAWLPDTEGPGIPGLNSFHRGVLRSLALTPSQKKKWHRFIRRQLEQECKQNCPMAPILLRMLQDDPLKRPLASICRAQLDCLNLLDEGVQVEPQSFHKRRANEAQIDAVNAPRRIRRNSAAGPVPETCTATLASISEEQLNPSHVKTLDVPETATLRPRTNQKLEASQDVEVALYPDKKEINAADLVVASGSEKWADHIQHWLQGQNRLTYESGIRFMRYLVLAPDIRLAVEKAMESGQKSVLIRRRLKAKKYDQRYRITTEGGFFVHFDPHRSLANATQICKAAGFQRQWLLHCDFTSREYSQVTGRQGTFVPNSEALKLCELVRLNQKLLKEAIENGREAVWVPITERLQVQRGTAQGRQAKRRYNLRHSKGTKSPIGDEPDETVFEESEEPLGHHSNEEGSASDEEPGGDQDDSFVRRFNSEIAAEAEEIQLVQASVNGPLEEPNTTTPSGTPMPWLWTDSFEQGLLGHIR